jgi:GntR family transcriptional repressor for pyruvate dehydrogenase complex
MGPAAIRPVRKRTVVDGVIEEIKRLLRAQEMQAGAKLPGERELSRRLGVSRPSVREALRTLERMGVLDTRHGSGTQVAASGSNVLRDPFDFLLMLDQPTVADLHETRELLEVHLAGQAAQRRTPRDLEALQAALVELRLQMDRRQGYTLPDFQFHRALAAAAHNPLLERIMNSLQEHVYALMDSVTPTVHNFAASYAIHEKIHRAVARGHAREARRQMKVHHDMMTDELRKAKRIG